MKNIRKDSLNIRKRVSSTVSGYSCATDFKNSYALRLIADIAVFKSDMALFKSDMAVFKSVLNT